MSDGFFLDLPTVLSVALLFSLFYIALRGLRIFRQGIINFALAFILTLGMYMSGISASLATLFLGGLAFTIAAASLVGVLFLSSILREPVLKPIVKRMRLLPRRKAIGLFAAATIVPALSIGLGFGVALGIMGFLIGFGVGTAMFGGMFALEWMRQKAQPKTAEMITQEEARQKELEAARQKIAEQKEVVMKAAEKGEIAPEEAMKMEVSIEEQERGIEELKRTEARAIEEVLVETVRAKMMQTRKELGITEEEKEKMRKREERMKKPRWSKGAEPTYDEIWAEYQRTNDIAAAARNLGLTYHDVDRVVRGYQAKKK